jgi:hypothetical protein
MRPPLFVTIAAALSLTAVVHLPATIVRASSTPSSPLSLRLSGPNLIQSGESTSFRAFLVNGTAHSVEVPSPESIRNIIYLEWRAINLSNNTVKTLWAGSTVCGVGKRFSQQDFLILNAGQQLELLDVQIPEELVRLDGPGGYRISIRYAFPPPNAVLLPDDILQTKQRFDINSNELTVVFSEKR